MWVMKTVSSAMIQVTGSKPPNRVYFRRVDATTCAHRPDCLASRSGGENRCHPCRLGWLDFSFPGPGGCPETGDNFLTFEGPLCIQSRCRLSLGRPWVA